MTGMKVTLIRYRNTVILLGIIRSNIPAVEDARMRGERVRKTAAWDNEESSAQKHKPAAKYFLYL
jgi:hypothetical protein